MIGIRASIYLQQLASEDPSPTLQSFCFRSHSHLRLLGLGWGCFSFVVLRESYVVPTGPEHISILPCECVKNLQFLPFAGPKQNPLQQPTLNPEGNPKPETLITLEGEGRPYISSRARNPIAKTSTPNT